MTCSGLMFLGVVVLISVLCLWDDILDGGWSFGCWLVIGAWVLVGFRLPCFACG